MTPSEWAQEIIENRSGHVPVLWVEDPYAILDTHQATALSALFKRRGRNFVIANNAFTLREQLLDIQPFNGGLVVVDQSCTPRQSHLLPQDCKPQDFVPLSAPDWRPKVDSNGNLALSVREFLIACTGDENWPAEVNLYPYEALARRRPERFVEACDDFKRSGRPLTSDDLRMVGASAVLDEDLFELNNPLTALNLAFHSADRWTELAEYFNPDEIAAIRARLQKIEEPIGHLFGTAADKARLALTSLIVLRQHFPEPAAQLAALDSGLLTYQDCEVPLLMEAPAWFVEQEIPRFERLLNATFKQHLVKHFMLEDAKKASEFATRERFSREMRNLAPFETIRIQSSDAGKENEFEIGRLVSVFMSAKTDLAKAVNAARSGIQTMKLTAPSRLSVGAIKTLFVDNGLCMVDSYIGQINATAQDIEGPARGDWKDLSWFEKRWQAERNEALNLAAEARGLLNDLDYNFGRLLETRYQEITPGEVGFPPRSGQLEPAVHSSGGSPLTRFALHRVCHFIIAPSIPATRHQAISPRRQSR